MSFQGIELTPEMRKIIVNVKHFFDQSKKKSELFDNPASALTASAVGINETTVKKIMSEFNKNGENSLYKTGNDRRGKPVFSFECGIESSVREFVRDSNKKGKQITVDIISNKLSEIVNFKIINSTLWRSLTRWGFEFGKGTRTAHLKESEQTIIKRRRYLREKIENRNSDGTTIRPEIYLDESYVNKNHSRDDTWLYGEDTGFISKPTGKGERLIIVNAIQKDGWVPNAKLVFKANKKSSDYHTNMNWKEFSSWFSKQLLPNIPKNSLIILDNASYHNVLSEGTFPKKSHKISILQEWLSHNDIPWKKDMLKAELYELCSRFSPKPEFALDRIAAEKGHKILRTPPYHPELQPIERCWGVAKNHVAAHNDFTTMEKVNSLLEEGFLKVTSETIFGILKKVKKQEDDFWIEDSKFLEIENNLEEEVDTLDEEDGNL